MPGIRDKLHGRDKDLEDLKELVASERLVTLLGPGGTGKTRLSIELGTGMSDQTLVVFVDLAAVRTATGLHQVLAQSLGVQTGQNANVLAACTAYLRPRDALLIVDNCEHLVGAAAELVSAILADTTATTVLATSRARLGLTDEALFQLSPLPVLLRSEHLTAEVTRGNAAAALFLDRVKRVERKFELTDANCKAVADLCLALDGLPLALELAASRMGVFKLEDLVARLDRRLDLLRAERSDVTERHQSLRALLDWSYELLDAEQQRMLRVLSAFPAGVTLDGAEWMGQQLGLRADPIVVLTQLVEASLLTRRETRSGRRYGQLETMRTFGFEQLDVLGERSEAEELAAAWAIHFSHLARAESRGPDEARYDDLVRQEIPNLRYARQHLIHEQRVAELVSISVQLDEWAQLRDVSEIWTWSDELAKYLPDLSSVEQANIHTLLAQGRWRRGRIESALEHGRLAYELAEIGSWAFNRSLTALGTAELFRGRLDAAADAWTQSWEADGNALDEANAALAISYTGDVATGLPRALAVMEHAQGLQYPTAVAWTHYIAGEILSLTAAPEARRHLETAAKLAAEIGSSFTVGVAGVTLATGLLNSGDTAAAADKFAGLIEHWLKSGSWTQLWTTLRHAARLISLEEPRLALALINSSRADPHSPQLDDAASTDEEAFASDLRTRLEAANEDIEGDAVRDRSELAESTRRALLSLAS